MMIRKARASRSTSRQTAARNSVRPDFYRAQIESLEERQLLSGQDLLVSVYDDTAGKSVLRYNDVTYAPAAGTVATGDNFLYAPQGVAVKSDGSFYVSNPAAYGVSHYSGAGVFIDAITLTPTYSIPGTLKVSPADGLLYVGDIGTGQIVKIDMTSDSIVGSMSMGYAPAGITFVPDGSNDMVVSGFDTQGIIRYTSGGPVTLVNPGSGINALALLAEANGDVLVADSDLGVDPTNHHQILLVHNDIPHTITQFANLTTPVGGGPTFYPPQPTTLLYDHDGNLLVGLAPDHTGTGAVEKVNIGSGAYMSTLVSGIGAPTGLAFIPSIEATVVGTHLFYDNSFFDGNAPGVSPSDDAAIATDKTAYLPGGGAATFSSVSSYTRGINGLMLDLHGPHGAISANDFLFKAGNDNSPASWTTAAAPFAVTVRGGAGVGGSDRVEILWADGAIRNEWLEVRVRGNDFDGGSDTNTGLASTYTFFYGNAPADSGAGDGGAFVTNSIDEQAARNDPHSNANRATITNVHDYNRDGLVNVIDQQATRNFANSNATAPKFINIGAGGPFAPAAAGDSGVASAVAATAGGNRVVVSVDPPAAIPPALIAQAHESSVTATIDWSTNAVDVESDANPSLDDELLEVLAASAIR
jgi:hypothetical protein